MFRNRRLKFRLMALCLGMICSSILISPVGQAKQLMSDVIPITQRLEVLVGKATIVRFSKAPIRVSLSNPGIIYLLQISTKEWEIIGRNPGVTNMFVWTDKDTIEGSEISVGLPPPPYLKNSPAMEMLEGDGSELIYLGHPPETIHNSQAARSSGLESDMPEPCLVPGCI